ncbi:MFS transporter [Sphingomonas sp. PAMC 26621]|uniref:MFS transporter n=1 Tax=Sphingomonas sp. PAMC 26621 TaxID=1112213 RepID=UPI003082E26A
MTFLPVHPFSSLKWPFEQTDIDVKKPSTSLLVWLTSMSKFSFAVARIHHAVRSWPMHAVSSSPEQSTSRTLFRLSIGVFLAGGFLTAVVGLLVPRLTITFGLGYSRATLIQFAFHLSYLIFAVPIALAVLRIGYMRAIVVGLTVMVLGCALLICATVARSFALLLFALLTLSTGITFLQIAANTVVTVVGGSSQAAARLTLLQGFNALGTVLGPLIGAMFLLGVVGHGTPGSRLWAVIPFVIGAVFLTGLAVAFQRYRDLLPRPAPASQTLVLRRTRALLCNRRLAWGAAAIFAYVGAEVTIGTLLPNFLMLPTTLHAMPVIAGQMASLYWGGAMIGRFAGAYLLQRCDAGLALFIASATAIALTTVGAFNVGSGLLASIALIAVGLCNAIMYPTVYAIALPIDPTEAPLGSMLLCMAVVGGAIIPLMTGALADRIGLPASLMLPGACYLLIASFGWSARR